MTFSFLNPFCYESETNSKITTLEQTCKNNEITGYVNDTTTNINNEKSTKESFSLIDKS